MIVADFRTDTEISRANHQKRERELQAWQPDPVADPPNGASPVPLSVPNSSNNLAAFQRSDDVTFGPNVGGTWDQFAANERLFGVTTQFDEDLYTTKLDRSAKDFKERERRAEKIAQEITNVSDLLFSSCSQSKLMANLCIGCACGLAHFTYRVRLAIHTWQKNAT